jgi:asparagine synthase (glutamine-hydrolysing)
MRDGWTKYVLRRAMDRRLPSEIQWRRDKMGFVTPEGEWLRAGRDHVAAALTGELASRDFLDGRVLRARLDDYVRDTGRTVYYTDVFRWYIVELWMRHAFASSALRAPADDSALPASVSGTMP